MPVPPALRVRGGGLRGAAHAAAGAARRPVDGLPALRALPGSGRGRPGRGSRSDPVMSGGPLDPAGPAGSSFAVGQVGAAGNGPLLAARDLAVYFAVGSALSARIRHEQRMLHAVDGVDLDLARGEALALVGESGSGRSTLARALAGRRPADRGEITFDGRRLPARRSRADQRRIQMVFQDPYSSLNPRLTVGGMLRELLKVHHIVPNRATETYSKELLTLVALGEDALRAYPRPFAGGPRRRRCPAERAADTGRRRVPHQVPDRAAGMRDRRSCPDGGDRPPGAPGGLPLRVLAVAVGSGAAGAAGAGVLRSDC